MTEPIIDWRTRCARLIAKCVAELHRLRIPFTKKVVLPLNVEALELSLIEIHDVFGKHGICFWLRDGTALGVIRDGRIIASDHDVDLGIWPEDLPTLDPALRELESEGFTVYRHTRWVISLLRRWESIEIIVSKSWAQTDDYNYFVDSFFADLKSVEYLGREFKVPQDSEAYLEFLYGKDWVTPKPFLWWTSSCWLPNGEREAYRKSFMSRHKRLQAERREVNSDDKSSP